jgi:hypothetical protein
VFKNGTGSEEIPVERVVETTSRWTMEGEGERISMAGEDSPRIADPAWIETHDIVMAVDEL